MNTRTLKANQQSDLIPVSFPSPTVHFFTRSRLTLTQAIKLSLSNPYVQPSVLYLHLHLQVLSRKDLNPVFALRRNAHPWNLKLAVPPGHRTGPSPSRHHSSRQDTRSVTAFAVPPIDRNHQRAFFFSLANP